MNRTYDMSLNDVAGVRAGAAFGRAARIAGFVLFTAISAQLAVRLPYTPVPVTMQTLFVVLAGVILGPKDGFYAMAAYLGLGIAGAPVFAGFSFGPAVVFGPTGGYLLAFPAAAMLAGAVSRAGRGSRPAIAAAVVSALAAILVCGSAYLALFTGLSLRAVMALAVTPFMAGEALKAVLAVLIAIKR